MTLIESLVALTILSIALIAYLNALQAANQASRKGDYVGIATRAAGDQITQCQATSLASLTDGTTNYTVSSLPYGKMTVQIGSPGGNTSLTNIKVVDVTVTWIGPAAAPQLGGRVQMSTLVSATR